MSFHLTRNLEGRNLVLHIIYLLQQHTWFTHSKGFINVCWVDVWRDNDITMVQQAKVFFPWNHLCYSSADMKNSCNIFKLHMCVCWREVCVMKCLQRSEDSLQKSIMSFTIWVLRTELGSSGLAGAFFLLNHFVAPNKWKLCQSKLSSPSKEFHNTYCCQGQSVHSETMQDIFSTRRKAAGQRWQEGLQLTCYLGVSKWLFGILHLNNL